MAKNITVRMRKGVSLLEPDSAWGEYLVSNEDRNTFLRPAPFAENHVITRDDLKNIITCDYNFPGIFSKIKELDNDHDGCVVCQSERKVERQDNWQWLRIKCDDHCICDRRLEYYTLSMFKEHYEGDITKIPKQMWSKILGSFKHSISSEDKAVLLELYFADRLEAYRILTSGINVEFTPDEIEQIVKAPNFWISRRTMSGADSVEANIAALFKNHVDSVTFETVAYIMNQPTKYSERMFKIFKHREKFYRSKFKDKEEELVLLFESIT